MEDTETNQRLLNDLLTFSFVLTVPGSSDFTYHDSTRQLLWQDWQATKNVAEFANYKNRLLNFYRSQGVARQRKEYETALKYFNWALELAAGDGSHLAKPGANASRQQSYQVALTDLERSLTFTPVNTDTYFAIGIACYYLQKMADCQTAFSKVIELEPTNAAAFYNRGVCTMI